MFQSLRYWTRRISRNWVYTARSGLWQGLWRRGGFDFLPFRPLDKDAAFLASLDLQGKTVYDVGGFVGLFSLFFARAVAQGQVVTFEPVPSHRELILDHLTLNQMQNVRLLPYALGAKTEAATILVCDEMGAYSTVHPQQKQRLSAENNCHEIPIQIVRLDELILQEKLPLPDFIKLDVEGLEFAALQGMAETIREQQPTLFIELHGFDNAAIAEWLLQQDYRIWQVRDELEISLNNLEQAKRFLYAYPKSSA